MEITEVKILRGTAIKKDGVSFHFPNDLIKFVKKYPALAKKLEAKEVIKIITKKIKKDGKD